MDIFRKNVIRSLKESKERTVATILGIALTAGLFVAVTTLMCSVFINLKENEIQQDGKHHAVVYDTNGKNLKKIKDDDRLENLGIVATKGFSYMQSEGGRSYLYVGAYDDNYIKNNEMKLREGRLPKNNKEIVISEQYLDAGYDYIELGKEVELELGYRESVKSKDGYVVKQEDRLKSIKQEKLVNTKNYKYKVVGYYKDDKTFYGQNYEFLISSQNYMPCAMALTYDNNNQDYKHGIIYLKFKEKFDFEYDTTLLYKDLKIDYDDIRYNVDVVSYSTDSEYGEIGFYVQYFFAGFLAVIGIVSCIYLYSIFAITTREKVKQVGILSTVGASHRQIRIMLIEEILLESIIGIPIGLCAGIGGMRILSIVFRDKINDLLVGDYEIEYIVKWPYVVWAVLITVLVVLVSVFDHIHKISKINTIDAVTWRNNKIDKKERKILKSHNRFTAKLFKLEKDLAKRYYVSKKGRYRSVIACLVIMMVVFNVSFYIAQIFTNEMVNTYTYTNGKYDFRLIANKSELKYVDDKNNNYLFEALKEKYKNTKSSFKEVKNVTDKTFSIVDENGYAFIPSEMLNKEGTSYYYGQINGEDHYGKDIVYLYIDKESYEKLLDKENLDKDKYLNTNKPKAIIYNKYIGTSDISAYNKEYKILNKKIDKLRILDTVYHEKKAKSFGAEYNYELTDVVDGLDSYTIFYQDKRALDGEIDDDVESTIPIEDFSEEAKYKEIKIGDYVETLPLGINIIDESKLYVIYPDSVAKNGDYINVAITSGNNDKTYTSLQKWMSDNGYSNKNLEYVQAHKNSKQSVKEMVYVLMVLFSALIGFASIMNVFNVMSVNLATRKRDLAMLKSLGMSDKKINSMLGFECIQYGVRESIIGTILSIIGNVWISDHLLGVLNLNQNIINLIISNIVVYLVVFFSTAYSYRKMKNENIIETLKDENV